MAAERLEVVVTAHERLAHDLAALEFATTDGSLLPPFEAGAHVEVTTPSGQVRPYSLCGDPADRSRYRIGVLRVENTTGVSRFLCDETRAGDRLRISAPRNLFPLAEAARRTVLIGGGIGITPLMAMAHRLKAIGADFSLHYCVRTRERAVFADELAGSGLSDHLHLHFSGDRRFRLGTDAPAIDVTTHVYVCGPEKMMAQVLADARGLGCAETQLHKEYFDVDSDSSGDSFRVELASGGSFTVGRDERIVDLLLARGCDIEVSCEKGICGSCIVKVLAGTPDHRDHYLTDEEKADQIAACCSRSLTPVLLLDL